MKILTLVRHGKSSRDDPGLPDFERPLNERGRKDCRLVARKLRKAGVRPDRLVSSPALRAITTAHAFAEVFGIPLADITLNPHVYEASAMTLLHIVHTLDAADDEAMLFGHNPGLSHLARKLAVKSPIEELPTCGVLRLEFPVKAWIQLRAGTGKVLQLVTPKEVPTRN
ncbi:MAG TPA: histidine phosphatase family protein [Candidatus Binatia bacterium]|nr:histidine phosphatase family protein [Candidatus Binatia bacterium]